MRTEIEVVIIVEHDGTLNDDELGTACEALAGQVLVEGLPGYDHAEQKHVVKGAVVVDEVSTIWVKGDAR